MQQLKLSIILNYINFGCRIINTGTKVMLFIFAFIWSYVSSIILLDRIKGIRIKLLNSVWPKIIKKNKRVK